jgi:hypothetical protein
VRYKTLARLIREKELEKAALNTKLTSEIDALKASCRHNIVVTLRSYYGGSYSMDSDDWHPETRLCLICGITESGSSEGTKSGDFKKLHNPLRRLELNRHYETPVGHELLKKPLKVAFDFVNTAGFEC